jgi:alpha-tubulin suppressor-like RCC1 family protein
VPVHIASGTGEAVGVILSDGSFWCWGIDNGDECNQSQPFAAGLAPQRGLSADCLVSLTGRIYSFMGLTADGRVLEWGAPEPSTVMPPPAAGQVREAPLPERARWAGGDSIAIGESGSLYWWGGGLGDWKMTGVLTAPAPTLWTDPSNVLVADFHSTLCATDAARTLYCWGNNRDGTLGDGTLTARLTPGTPVLSDVLDVRIGDALSVCARRADGTVWCWGDGEWGELGNGQAVDQRSPVKVDLPIFASGLSVGFRAACAWDDVGTLYCWGANSYHAIADDSVIHSTPIPVDMGGPVREAAVTESTLCAILEDDSVWCRGLQTIAATTSLHRIPLPLP